MRTVLCALALLAAQVTPTAAQERRVAVAVDYIAGADVYVALGSRDGLVQADSVPVYFSATGERRGSFFARVVTLRRAVLTFAGPRFELTAGDTLWLGLLRPPPAADLPQAAQLPQRGDTLRPGSPVRRASAVGGPRAVRVDGRVGLDLETVESDVFEGGSRRYTTPTLRVQAVAADLPGGFRFSTSLRASRLASSVEGLESVTSVRLYEASVEREFTAVPLRLQAGRFVTPLDPYGGYWDGFLARLGGKRFGIGAAAGFLPQRANESFSADVPRISAFADYHADSGALRYDAELGLHTLRPRTALADQTFVGLGQRLRWRGMWLSQSLQADRATDGNWTVSAVQVNAVIPLIPGLALRAGGARHRAADLDGIAPLPTYSRDRGSFGIGYFGPALGVNGDFTVTRRPDGRTTRAYTASAQVPRILAGMGIGASATRSDSERFRATYLSGDLSRSFGRAFARLGLRSVSYDGLLSAQRSDGAELMLSIPLTGRAQAAVYLESWRGNAGGPRQRILTSLSTGF